MIGALFAKLGSLFEESSSKRTEATPERPAAHSLNAVRTAPAPSSTSPQETPAAGGPAPTPQAPPVTPGNSASLHPDNDPVLLRRDITNDRLEVVAYEFSLRGELHENVRATGRGVRSFLDQMLISHVTSLDPAVLRERAVFLPLAESTVRNGVLDRLPARARILLAPDHAGKEADPVLLARLAALKEAGIEVWADDCSGSRWMASAASVIQGAMLRVAWRMPMEIADGIAQLREQYPGLPIAAWDVHTMEEFDAMARLQCVQFSGGFATHRGNWSGQTLSPQVMCVATLINRVREDADMREIAVILRQDMAMSYRLMRYVNTAARGLNHQLSSIEQALLVMGQAQLDRWLTLMLLGGSLGGNGAILEAALVRARFMELLGQGYRGGEMIERLFVLGLFSMLDIALKVPLAEAIRPLNLPAPMSDALLEHKGVLGSFLSLAEACQQGDADTLLRQAVTLGLTVRKVNAKQLEAITWVNAPDVPQQI